MRDASTTCTHTVTSFQILGTHRFSCSIPAPATRSRHLHTGRHQGYKHAAPWLKAHIPCAVVPGPQACPGFDIIFVNLDASTMIHIRSSSRHTTDPLVAGLFRSRFPPWLLNDMTLRRFGISACTANPEGLPPLLIQHDSCWRSSTSSPLSFQDKRSWLNLAERWFREITDKAIRRGGTPPEDVLTHPH